MRIPIFSFTVLEQRSTFGVQKGPFGASQQRVPGLASCQRSKGGGGTPSRSTASVQNVGIAQLRTQFPHGRTRSDTVLQPMARWTWAWNLWTCQFLGQPYKLSGFGPDSRPWGLALPIRERKPLGRRLLPLKLCFVSVNKGRASNDGSGR